MLISAKIHHEVHGCRHRNGSEQECGVSASLSDSQRDDERRREQPETVGRCVDCDLVPLVSPDVSPIQAPESPHEGRTHEAPRGPEHDDGRHEDHDIAAHAEIVPGLDVHVGGDRREAPEQRHCDESIAAVETAPFGCEERCRREHAHRQPERDQTKLLRFRKRFLHEKVGRAEKARPRRRWRTLPT